MICGFLCNFYDEFSLKMILEFQSGLVRNERLKVQFGPISFMDLAASVL